MPSYELTESTFTPIPEGEIIPAEVVKVEAKTWDARNPGEEPNTRINFRFIVTEGEFQGRTLFGSTPETFTTNPDCKLRSWSQEILGLDAIPVGFKLKTEELEGRICRVLVGHREKKDADGNANGIREFAQDVIRSAGLSQEAADIF